MNHTTLDPSETTLLEPLLWVPEPKFRGTFGIFSLCLSTMIISVWNAIHLDVPTYRRTTIHSFIHSVLWMLAALFCPELMMFIAFNQYCNARGVVRHARKHLSVESEIKKMGFFRRLLRPGSQVENDLEKTVPVAQTRRHLFTLVHGFYASMGGYVFELVDEEDKQKEPTAPSIQQTRMAITSMGIRFIMKHDPPLIPDLSENSITDRAQTSSLGKAILIAQLTWFCANCVARLQQKLPISLLEVTTVAHGLCTLVTYILWWSKPLNIAEPTLIRGKKARRICALMKMLSPDEKYMLFGTVSIQFPAEKGSVTILEDSGTRQDILLGISPSSQKSDPLEGEVAGLASDLPDHPDSDFVTLEPERKTLEGTNFTPRNELIKTPFHSLKIFALYDSRSVPWYAKRRALNEPIVLRKEEAERWELVSDAMKCYELDWKNIQPTEKPYVLPHASLQSSSDYKGRGLRAIVRSNLSASALTLIYGFPHILAWNTQFPTLLEQQLWRVASVAVTLWGVCMAFIVALIVIIRYSLGKFTGERRGEAPLVGCAASLYIVTAGYLLVESFRQLLYLEPAAYELPVLTYYWPHFS